MLFHEIYGAYFQTVCRILRAAGNDGITEKGMMDIIAENAFAESMLVIPEKLKSGAWPFLAVVEGGTDRQKRYKSILSHDPARSLTKFERQWLKSLLEDPRIRLFLYRESDEEVLEQIRLQLADVPPLYDRGSVVYYDRYSDGDNYSDEQYIQHYHTILRAIHERRMVFLEYTDRSGNTRGQLYYPYRIEYSSKDDKFRILCRSVKGTPYTFNMSRIRECALDRPAATEEMRLPVIYKKYVDLELRNERNALQRAMLHFSDLQKETERTDKGRYRIRLYYDKDDETEMVIRILAFGPMIRVMAPKEFIELITERIEGQARLCGL
ncbi:MAG: WYL domain-containing protein [Lachnospiraceae bacterium]|nr:WYL domain-containing protein [Lachnospiraceae bacterium]